MQEKEINGKSQKLSNFLGMVENLLYIYQSH